MAGKSFGTLFRYTSWGESHGPAIGVVIDGVPPKIPLAEPNIQQWLDRRRPGQSRYTTQRQEPDEVKILSGVFEGQTTGTPIQLMIENVDQRSRDYRNIADRFPGRRRCGGAPNPRPRNRDPWRPGADRPACNRPRGVGLERDRRQPVLVHGPWNRGALGRIPRRRAQGGVVGRRGNRTGGERSAGRD